MQSFLARFPLARPALGVFLLVLFAVPARPEPATDAPDLSVTDIVSKLAEMNAKRAAQLRSYRSTRRYTVEYRGFPSDKQARMTVDVSYEAPRKKLTIVSEEGSKLLLNRVLHKLVEGEQDADNEKNRMETALTERNYRFTLLGTETIHERRCYVLQVKPRRDHKFLYDGKIWVDAEEFAVTRIRARPAKNPSFWISSTSVEHDYAKQGEFWLPASNRSNTKVRLGGRALLAIDYGSYEFGSAQRIPAAEPVIDTSSH
jgi:outer membrane lipoprotein-sorting protein